MIPRFFLALVGVAAVSAGTAADDLFTGIFNRSLLTQRSLHAVRARFTETTVSTLLTKPIVAHGTIVAAPPGRVIMTYDDPDRKTVAIDGRTLTIVWPDRRERQQVDVGQAQKRIDQYFTRASIDDLRSMFQIAAAPEPSMRNVDRVEMRPKRKQIQQGLERLDLWIDRENGMLVQLSMFFPGGDQKTIALENIVANPPIGDETFRVTP